MTAENQFDSLCRKFVTLPGVETGNMMSSPGLKYNNKVFAFFYKKKMGFRLGPNFDTQKWGLKNPEPLSPFKTKPPLKGWLMIDQNEMDLWEPLAEMALTFTQTLK
ncbi:MAG: hypothetical protein RLO17_18335 [Cyclobacteriaceae bacterium]